VHDPGVCITRSNSRVERPGIRNEQRASERRVGTERCIDRAPGALSPSPSEIGASERDERRVLNDHNAARAGRVATDGHSRAGGGCAMLDQQARAKLAAAIVHSRRYALAWSRVDFDSCPVHHAGLGFGTRGDGAPGASSVRAARGHRPQKAAEREERQRTKARIATNCPGRAKHRGGNETQQRNAAEPEKESGGVCDIRCGDQWHGMLLLSACSHWDVVLGTMARVLVDSAHRVKHQHRDFGSCLVACERDARDGRSEWRAADVTRSSFVQGLSNDIIATSLTGAKLRMLRPELLVGLEHQFFQRVLHPAIGNDARSRL
jgi:hypothetical protein